MFAVSGARGDNETLLSHGTLTRTNEAWPRTECRILFSTGGEVLTSHHLLTTKNLINGYILVDIRTLLFFTALGYLTKI